LSKEAKNEYLLPWHRHILQELVNCMWNEFKGPKIDTFIMTILLGGHVPMVSVKTNTKMNTVINP
jgi:hypothetical protein